MMNTGSPSPQEQFDPLDVFVEDLRKLPGHNLPPSFLDAWHDRYYTMELVLLGDTSRETTSVSNRMMRLPVRFYEQEIDAQLKRGIRIIGHPHAEAVDAYDTIVGEYNADVEGDTLTPQKIQEYVKRAVHLIIRKKG